MKNVEEKNYEQMGRFFHIRDAMSYLETIMNQRGFKLNTPK